MSKSLPRLDLRYNRPIFGILLGACLLLVLYLAVSWISPWRAPFIYFLCAVGIPLALWSLLDRRPKLRVDEMGIRYSRWGWILVQWSEISHFEVRRFWGTEHITAIPINTTRLHDRVPTAWRINGYLSRLLGLGEFAIQAGGLDGGIVEIQAILSHYHEVRTEGSTLKTGRMLMQQSESLAWYRWPEPDGTHYFASDLTDPKIVEEVFDYCQIWLASVTKEGWRFLIKTHALSGLIAINKRSGWFDEEDDAEAMAGIREECLIAGYDPDTDQFGTYDEETGVFNPAREA